MESNEIKTDADCCKMRSVNGYCPKPLETASGFLSKKWMISIITTIGNFQKLRFNQIQNRVEGLTPKVLTQRLVELQNEEVISRKVFNESPPRVEYYLSEKGKLLREALVPLMHWAEHNS